jgi:hypothetical protein
VISDGWDDNRAPAETAQKSQPFTFPPLYALPRAQASILLRL